jgi:hypothetical protein
VRKNSLWTEPKAGTACTPVFGDSGAHRVGTVVADEPPVLQTVNLVIQRWASLRELGRMEPRRHLEAEVAVRGKDGWVPGRAQDISDSGNGRDSAVRTAHSAVAYLLAQLDPRAGLSKMPVPPPHKVLVELEPDDSERQALEKHEREVQEAEQNARKRKRSR